jgi:crotonobetainyl-CoA:carnitine CoA-transferase CaiB-like acyl-CoA transferase
VAEKAFAAGILAGLQVLEIGHFVAAPFCTRLLADLGADVIKIEPPGGDPVRQWGEQKNGRSLWWSMHARNKRSLALDLKSPKAREIVLKLVAGMDVVVENFRPGQLAKLGLGPEVLRDANPNLVVAQISGYGQNGPYRDRPAFGVIGEAVGGLRYLTNHPPGATSLPPVRVGVSIGDSVAGLYAAFGVMAALWQRDRIGGDGRARTIDVALTEAILSMMEGMLPEMGALGKIKQPTGGAIATAAPSNAYPTADGDWVLIAANSDPLFRRLADLMGRPHLVEMSEFLDNQARVQNREFLDRLIGNWTSRFSTKDVLLLLTTAEIPNSKIFNAADCATDPQYRYRGMVRDVEDPHLGNVLQAGIVPVVSETPGTIRWTGPEIGEHTREILTERLGFGEQQVAALYDEGIVRL